MTDKADINRRNITRDREGHVVTVKGSIYQHVTILHVYAPNAKQTQHSQTELKRETHIHNYSWRLGYFFPQFAKENWYTENRHGY